MNDKTDIEQLLEERPELFDGLDSGDLDRETGVQLELSDTMKKRMEQVAVDRSKAKQNTEST